MRWCAEDEGARALVLEDGISALSKSISPLKMHLQCPNSLQPVSNAVTVGIHETRQCKIAYRFMSSWHTMMVGNGQSSQDVVHS